MGGLFPSFPIRTSRASCLAAALAGAFLFAGCATTPPPEPKQAAFWYSKKPLAGSAWMEADRVVVVIESDEVAAQMVHGGYGLFDALGASPANASPPTPADDVSAQFARGARSVLDRRGMADLFRNKLEEAIRMRTKHEVVFIQKTPGEQTPLTWSPFDRLVVVAFHPSFVGTESSGAAPQVMLNSDVSWMVFREPSRFQQLSFERNSDQFAQNWRTRYNTLCDAYSFFSYESPAYGRSVWLFNDGLLVRDEMRRAVDRAILQITDDLFSSPLPAFRVQPTMRQLVVDVF
ncbi:MAG: hypothetical protein IT578_06530 [Verrucomicrobiae bacterium]|nr:hypothetical protein [Verrucomicrobiae bacterium]